MATLNFQTPQGFQLIEILITLSILAIVACFALPHYTGFFVKEKRLAAIRCLNELSVALEEYQLKHGSYAGASIPALHVDDRTLKNSYILTVETGVASYLVKAQPIGTQAEEDRLCEGLSMDEDGRHDVTGDGRVEDCW